MIWVVDMRCLWGRVNLGSWIRICSGWSGGRLGGHQLLFKGNVVDAPASCASVDPA